MKAGVGVGWGLRKTCVSNISVSFCIHCTMHVLLNIAVSLITGMQKVILKKLVIDRNYNVHIYITIYLIHTNFPMTERIH